MAKLAPVAGWAGAPDWTAAAALPGGDFPRDGVEALLARLRADYPFLADRHARRLVRAYGTRAWTVLGDAAAPEDLGPVIGADLTGREVDYLALHEWAGESADILWRRSKLGLRFAPEETARLDAYLAEAGGRRLPSGVATLGFAARAGGTA